MQQFAAIGQSALGVIHDANTPLGVCVTALSELQQSHAKLCAIYGSGKIKKSDLDGFLNPAGEIIAIVLNNLLRMSELLRNFQQVAVDQVTVVPRRLNLKEYLDKVLMSLGVELRKTPHSLRCSIQDDIEVETYPGAFAQIVDNLVKNSLKHAFRPGQSGHIGLDIACDGRSITLAYTDDGMGIPEGSADRIYDLLYTGKRGNGGSGLGLFIVHDTVTRLLRGTIRCVSEPGQGTRFEITVPVSVADVAED